MTYYKVATHKINAGKGHFEIEAVTLVEEDLELFLNKKTKIVLERKDVLEGEFRFHTTVKDAIEHYNHYLNEQYRMKIQKLLELAEKYS